MSNDTTAERSYSGWNEKAFANAVVARGPGRLIYLSGVGALHPETREVQHEGDFVGQVEYSFGLIVDTLARHGATLDDVVKLNVYVLDTSLLPDYNEVRFRAFEGSRLSAHTFIGVSGLPVPGMLIEIDVVAHTT